MARSPEELSLVIAEGSEEQLEPREGEHYVEHGVEVLVEAVRSFLRQCSCQHPGMRWFCPECGVASAESAASS